MISLPKLSIAKKLNNNNKRLFISAYGFEPRSLGWCKLQESSNNTIDKALLFKYKNPKGSNKVRALDTILEQMNVSDIEHITYNVKCPHDIEYKLNQVFNRILEEYEEVIVDITAMTKLLILVVLLTLKNYSGKLKIIYSEAVTYSPEQDEYDKSKNDVGFIAKFPSQGVGSIIRMKCMSSVRMQGQPVCLIAFTSFNEQLVRHILGTISPHKLIFINGSPPREDFKWREEATYEIHSQLFQDYFFDNPIDSNNRLINTVCTLDYVETVETINEIHTSNGCYNRIICAATGSKMQTVGLFFAKIMHPDIHIEYPTPDSYFFSGLSKGIKNIYEIEFPSFASFLKNINQ